MIYSNYHERRLQIDNYLNSYRYSVRYSFNGHHLITFAEAKTCISTHTCHYLSTWHLQRLLPCQSPAGEMKPELSWNVSSVVNFVFKYIFDWLQCFLAHPLPCLGDSAQGFINETLVAGQKHIPSACWSSWLK